MNEYKFKRKLEYIKSRQNDSQTLVSLYIPYDKPKKDIIYHLRYKVVLFSNIEPLSSKAMVKTLESLIEWLEHTKIPKKGMCIFTGISSDNDHNIEIIEVKPPFVILSYTYMCDDRYFTDRLFNLYTGYQFNSVCKIMLNSN